MTMVVIDTNLFYYWSGIKRSNDHDPIKIGQELAKFERVFLSQWSIVEFLTASHLTRADKERAFLFLSEKALPVLPISPGTRNLIPMNIFQFFGQPEFQNIVNQVQRFKEDAELSVLHFMVESLVAVLAIQMENDLELDTDAKKRNYQLQLQALIEGNRPFILRELRGALRAFYQVRRDRVFKAALENIIYPLFYVTTVTYNSALHGTLVSRLKEGPDQLNAEELAALRATLDHNPTFAQILDKMNNETEGGILDDVVGLRRALETYRTYFSQDFNRGFAYYVCELIDRVFLTGRKFRKNDLIDAQLFSVYPHLLLLTADGEFRGIMRVIDPEWERQVVAFLDSVKP